MVLDVSQRYPDPKLAPTNVKNFRRVARKMADCRRLSNNVRGRQMVEFKRRYAGGNSIAVELFTLGVGCHFRCILASPFLANPTRGISTYASDEE